MKTQVLSIDAWRDENGWFWNNWYRIEDGVEIPDGVTNRKLLKIARDDLGLLNENSKGKVSIEDDGYNLVIIARGTGKPLFAFCYGEDNG